MTAADHKSYFKPENTPHISPNVSARYGVILGVNWRKVIALWRYYTLDRVETMSVWYDI